MRGNLSDKLFPSILRDLAKENATGRLRLTQTGQIREILIESGVPVFASSTIPEEQPEYMLVQEGLLTPDQLDAAVQTARQTAQPVEKILVQTKTISRLGLQRILCELSTTIVNSSSEWLTGDYRFVAAQKVPLEAKLIWTSTECILAGARHASANNSVLDAMAADNCTVKPASDPGSTGASSASLSSTEGYVLSCIQSPTTVAEASMLTGLSHTETRRAILVLIMLGLLEAEGSGVNGSGAVKESRTDGRASQSLPAAREVRPAAQPGQSTRSAVTPAPTPHSHATRQSSAQDSGTLPSDPRASDRNNGCKPGVSVEPESWPLDLESNNHGGLDDDSSQIDFNSGDISFVDFPEQARPPQTAEHQRQVPGHASTGNQEVSPGRMTPPVEETVASAPAAAPSEQVRLDSPQAPSGNGSPTRGKTGSIFIPGRTLPRTQESATSSPTGSGPVSSIRENAGSIFIPGRTGSLSQEQVNSSPATARPAPAVSRADSSDSDIGYGWNGESDPRLHQEWREQVEAAASQDKAVDERFLKRVIEELAAKIRIAASADYYQILGVDKLASNGSITKAYERVTRVNDSHKSRWPYNSELQSQISSLMVMVNKAYETLGNPEKRRVYDMPAGQQAPAVEVERGSGPMTGSSSTRAAAVPPPPRPAPLPAHPSPAPQGYGGPMAAAPETVNPYQSAEELYRRGRAAFTRSDLQAAAHLLRQAVNLDPNRSTYHYQLGMTLFILSQARAEHKHDKGCHVTCKMGGNLTRNQRIRHEAEQHLLKASELEPSNSDIKLKLALLYKDAHMDRKAHQYFYEALMLDPNCHIARVELGMEDASKRENDEDQWIKDLMKDRSKKK